jgi:hypothetical protein
MKIARVLATLVVTTGLLATVANAQEKKINLADLPAGAQKTIAEQSKGATIRGFTEEKENGQTHYEAEMMVNGHSKDIEMDAAGVIVEVEEQVEIDSLSVDVKAGLQARALKGKLVKVESITRHGKLVAYEAKVLTNGKKSEIQVGPEGQSLKHEE